MCVCVCSHMCMGAPVYRHIYTYTCVTWRPGFDVVFLCDSPAPYLLTLVAEPGTS